MPVPHLQLTPQLEALYDQLDEEGESHETLQEVPDRVDASAVQSPASAHMEDQNSGVRRRPRLLL